MLFAFSRTALYFFPTAKYSTSKPLKYSDRYLYWVSITKYFIDIFRGCVFYWRLVCILRDNFLFDFIIQWIVFRLLFHRIFEIIYNLLTVMLLSLLFCWPWHVEILLLFNADPLLLTFLIFFLTSIIWVTIYQNF